MAERDSEGSVAALNETGAGEGLPGRRPMSERRAADYESVLAGLETDDLEAPAPAAAKKTVPAAKKAAKAPVVEEPEEDSDDDASDDDEDDTDVDAASDEDDDDDAKVSDENSDEEDDDEAEDDDDEEDSSPAGKQKAKALRAIAQAERRSKERDRDRRAEFERDTQRVIDEWKPRIAAAEKFEQLVQGAKTNKVSAVLRFAQEVAGLDGDDFEFAGRELFLRSPKAQQDPKARDAAVTARTQHETLAKLQEAVSRIDQLDSELKEERTRAVNTSQAKAYIERAVGAVSKETPLVRRLLKTDGEDARVRLHRLAVELAEENAGQALRPGEVVKELERRQRRELKRLGIDWKAVVGKKTTEDPASQNGGVKTAKTGSKKPANGKPSGDAAKLQGRALFNDVLRGLKEGRQ